MALLLDSSFKPVIPIESDLLDMLEKSSKLAGEQEPLTHCTCHESPLALG